MTKPDNIYIYILGGGRGLCDFRKEGNARVWMEDVEGWHVCPGCLDTAVADSRYCGSQQPVVNRATTGKHASNSYRRRFTSIITPHVYVFTKAYGYKHYTQDGASANHTRHGTYKPQIWVSAKPSTSQLGTVVFATSSSSAKRLQLTE